MSTDAYIALSVLEAVLLVAVLAVALIQVRRRLENIAGGLETLGGALASIERDHLSLIGPAVAKINDPLSAIVGALPGIAEKAETVANG
jgi:hypothetical protein